MGLVWSLLFYPRLVSPIDSLLPFLFSLRPQLRKTRFLSPSSFSFLSLTTKLIKLPTALYDLYTSTNGNEWFTNDNWLIGDPCLDAWYGVYGCSLDSEGNQHVVHLYVFLFFFFFFFFSFSFISLFLSFCLIYLFIFLFLLLSPSLYHFCSFCINNFLL